MLRIAVIIVAALGAVSSIYFGQQRFMLQQELKHLARQVGYLQIQDVTRIHIISMPENDGIVPPGIEAAHVWRFRIYLPAGFSPAVMTRRQAVSANSPRSQGGGGWSSGSAAKESKETELIVSLLKTENGWLLSRTSDGSSNAGSVGPELVFDSLDDWVVEPVVTPMSGAKSFSVDDAICILRVREKEPVNPRDGNEPLYRGFVVYMYNADHQAIMDQWVDGTIDAWPEEIEP